MIEFIRLNCNWLLGGMDSCLPCRDGNLDDANDINSWSLSAHYPHLFFLYFFLFLFLVFLLSVRVSVCPACLPKPESDHFITKAV